MLTMEMQKKMVEVSADTHCRSLFLTDCFTYLHCSAPSTWSKTGLQKKTDRIGPDPEVGGSRSRTPKTSVSPQVAPKTGSATKSQILLTTRLMSTSGALTHLHSLEVAPSAQLCLSGFMPIRTYPQELRKNSEFFRFRDVRAVINPLRTGGTYAL